MAITPIQYIQPEPHVPLGQKISALNAAADQSILNQQNIKANKLKLASAEQAAKDEAGLNAVVKAGGDDQTMLDSSRNVSAGAYTQLREMLAKASKADLEKIKANTDAKKSFYDLMADRVMTINNAPEENRAILWKNIVAGMKSSGIPDAANLPDQYDPVIAGQYVDAKKQLDFLKSELDINIAKGNEAAKVVERDTAQAKTLAEIENSKTTPAIKEFNYRFYTELLPEKGIDLKTLNSETEGKLRAELRQEIEAGDRKYEQISIKVDGKGPVAALQDQYGNYIDATTRKPITGKIDVYERDRVSEGPASQNDKIRWANTLRDDYNQESKPARDREDIYNLIDGMRDEPQNGPNDIVLIYNFVKLNDPNAAREGELALVQSGASIPDTWRRYVGNFLTGDKLGPEQRKQLLNASDRLYESGIKPTLQELNTRYSASASDAGVDPKHVIRPMKGPKVATTQTGPQKGDKQTYNGSSYTFDGTQYVKDK